MEDLWPVILMGVAGLLAGGVVSMVKAKKPVPAVVCGVLAALALAGAVAWWWPAGNGA